MSRDPAYLPVTHLGDGSAEYRATGGEVLDHLCWRHYGREFDTFDAVVASNRGLGSGSAVLGAGQMIRFPYLPAAKAPVRSRIRLFD